MCIHVYTCKMSSLCFLNQCPVPEVLHIIQLTFFLIIYQKVAFQLQHFFYISTGETAICIGELLMKASGLRCWDRICSEE